MENKTLVSTIITPMSVFTDSFEFDWENRAIGMYRDEKGHLCALGAYLRHKGLQYDALVMTGGLAKRRPYLEELGYANHIANANDRGDKEEVARLFALKGIQVIFK